MSLELMKSADLPEVVRWYVEETNGVPFFMTDKKIPCLFVAHEEMDGVAIFTWQDPNEVHMPAVLTWDEIDTARELYQLRNTPINEL